MSPKDLIVNHCDTTIMSHWISIDLVLLLAKIVVITHASSLLNFYSFLFIFNRMWTPIM